MENVVHNTGGAAEFPVASAQQLGLVLFRAGDDVPAPGSYWVWHHQHRAAHAAKVRFPVFPECAQCGRDVRYLPMSAESSAPEWLRRDPDFRHALIRKGRRPLQP